eukprot:jgi/Mesvir1/7425/Mv19207-RA.2
MMARRRNNGDDASTLAQENVRLRKELDRLRLDLRKHEEHIKTMDLSQHGHVDKSGYLNKFRPFASIIEHQWGKRFFILVGDTLMYHMRDKDARSLPHGTIKLANQRVIVEGIKKGKYFTFRIVDADDGVLLRLSSAYEPEGKAWVDAFKEAGCTVEYQSQLLPRRRSSIMRSSSGTANGGKPAGPPPGPVDANLVRPSSVVHRHANYSLLSSESFHVLNHSGFVNLLMVLLVAANCRLIIENLLKYGILIRPGFWLGRGRLEDHIPLLVGWLLLVCNMAFGYAIEAWASKMKTNEKIIAMVNCINILATLVLPSMLIHISHSEPLPGFALLMVTAIVMMKLISYAHTSYDLRRMKFKGIPAETPVECEPMEYPDNVTLNNVLYFFAAPTLCYQMTYPRTPSIRWRWLVRRAVELVLYFALMLFMAEQYVHPTIRNSIAPLQAMDLPHLMERVLKLSVPALYVWLCMFYCLFHLWLNITGELLRFADREFYKDWWNATTIEKYWRLWNIPVHKWLVRHLYFPCRRLGINTSLAMFITFFWSAVFHEVTYFWMIRSL